MEALLTIWESLSKRMSLKRAALFVVLILMVWGVYWHVFRFPLNSVGEWVDGKIRVELSLPPKPSTSYD